jgi:hypothetical protein
LSDLDDAVDQIVDRALSLSIPLGVRDPVPEPADLRRSDGTSVYEVHGFARFTSARILSAEQQILRLARSYGGRTLTEVRVGIAVSESAANGVELNDAQTAMVHNLATSGAYLQLALAPAGTGKTTAMHVLSRAWADSGGRVLGLAPSAQAAHAAWPRHQHRSRQPHRHPRQADLDPEPRTTGPVAGLGASDRPAQPGDHRRGRPGRDH